MGQRVLDTRSSGSNKLPRFLLESLIKYCADNKMIKDNKTMVEPKLIRIFKKRTASDFRRPVQISESQDTEHTSRNTGINHLFKYLRAISGAIDNASFIHLKRATLERHDFCSVDSKVR
ncbi:hypothetical protein CDAR_411651 [Caerostris darwini]|uniref:Uncharacterized protein n=1 Tax=Caerostris darwini TaxID=1538125 RepID=A0AAV4MJX7_9ARAC|nr:hypothetical protein CDAR_411651 [Caerostris darwini]